MVNSLLWYFPLKWITSYFAAISDNSRAKYVLKATFKMSYMRRETNKQGKLASLIQQMWLKVYL